MDWAMLRIFLASLLMSAALLGSGASLAQIEAETAALKKAEAYLNNITTMKARFLQVNPDGSSVEGDVYVSRPGRMRLVYDPPTPMLLVADGAFLIYVDTEMKDVSHISLDDTPAGLLLKDNLSFTDPGVKLGGVKLGAGTVEVTASMTKDPSSGKLTLVFSEAPFELRQWRVVDAQNKEVSVTLFQAQSGVKLDRDLFRYETSRSGGRD
jgi:outer membrane lipoprotein-sorting protein